MTKLRVQDNLDQVEDLQKYRKHLKRALDGARGTLAYWEYEVRKNETAIEILTEYEEIKALECGDAD